MTPTLPIRVYITFLLGALLVFGQVRAQVGQVLQVVKGKKVTLRADADHALSYVWFKDDVPLSGTHEQRIIVTDPGVYTVMALGDDCISDLSDPVRIVLDDRGTDVEVDLEIRNLPDKRTIGVGNTVAVQLIIFNKGVETAEDVVATFTIPPELSYSRIIGSYPGEVNYVESERKLYWRQPSLEGKSSAMLWLEVVGAANGSAVTLAAVSAKQRDRMQGNNTDDARIDIVQLIIPNVFTPNGDGLNDYFRIVGLSLFPGRRLTIYNRWGNNVYRSEQYENDWGGSGLLEGTYFYVLELTDETGRSSTYKGAVLIIRDRIQ
ncbi:T9SS type B sorting domain-containing protein [Sphingobacterium psychroaquaticum]|uniref:Gliding motility-associated C-terminal domain-containing protein n=1 Tax=Sphingobacterium psychroaquaticum TaxID=561061 RepID=A0A1X7JLT7_9SPHI|nr:gliding motility-associated C-terminal domain-containing protein [Sphingobacterium psychroaquaticum]QBQ40836.1 T9SS type B sorting domain-containing protein [Sphingobacterium psychroaquaticum]SMG29184.1 gliding motility-associated C-terminal domain-containing protein [Sphingobacterium psychroaquaticum]